MLITPLGIAVEPEVKRILATLSGPTGLQRVLDRHRRPGREELVEARRAVALGEHQLRAAEVDGRQDTPPNGPASDAYTSPGFTSAAMCLTLPKSWLISE